MFHTNVDKKNCFMRKTVIFETIYEKHQSSRELKTFFKKKMALDL